MPSARILAAPHSRKNREEGTPGAVQGSPGGFPHQPPPVFIPFASAFQPAHSTREGRLVCSVSAGHWPLALFSAIAHNISSVIEVSFRCSPGGSNGITEYRETPPSLPPPPRTPPRARPGRPVGRHLGGPVGAPPGMAGACPGRPGAKALGNGACWVGLPGAARRGSAAGQGLCEAVHLSSAFKCVFLAPRCALAKTAEPRQLCSQLKSPGR
jgi:hypothetical protein